MHDQICSRVALHNIGSPSHGRPLAHSELVSGRSGQLRVILEEQAIYGRGSIPQALLGLVSVL